MKQHHSRKEKPAFDLGLVLVVLRRYWWMALWPAVTVLLLGLLVSLRIPDFYTSTALLFIQPQRVSAKILENPNRDEMRERLEALVQEILSRPRLANIVDTFNLYPELRGAAGKERSVKKLQSAISVDPIQSPTGMQLSQTFRLGFTHTNPKVAHSVTERISQAFINESQSDRRTEIMSTEDFINGQLTETRRKLEQTENAVENFVKENAGRLPENRDGAIARLERAQGQLVTNTQLLSANSSRRTFLEGELSDIRRQSRPVALSGDGSDANPGDSLAQLEAALSVLRTKYSDEHPDVINAKRRIEALRRIAGASSGKGKGGKGPAYAMNAADNASSRAVKRELNDLAVQSATLTSENDRLKRDIEQLQSDIQIMPLKEQELVKIRRDYNSIRETYDKLLAAKDEAGLQSNLLKSEKATQFRILEPAAEPAQAAGPNRVLIILGSLGASLFVFALIPAVLYLLNRSYKSSSDLEEVLGVPVIGTIPPMITPESVLFKKRLMSGSLVASTISLVAGSALIFAVL